MATAGATAGATVAVETKPDLGELLERVAAGETVRLTRDGAVVARLEPDPGESAENATTDQMMERIRRMRRDRRLGDLDVKAMIDDGRERLASSSTRAWRWPFSWPTARPRNATRC